MFSTCVGDNQTIQNYIFGSSLNINTKYMRVGVKSDTVVIGTRMVTWTFLGFPTFFIFFHM